jgi:hypothetical protein
MIVEARTFACARAGCGRTFRNDTGAPRRYCSDVPADRREPPDRRPAARDRTARPGDARTKARADPAPRGGLAIADERGRLLESAIAAMCAACEPEGVCRIEDCPLRPFSPLPLEIHALRSEPRTEFAIRSASWTPERRPQARGEGGCSCGRPDDPRAGQRGIERSPRGDDSARARAVDREDQGDEGGPAAVRVERTA